MKYLMCNLKSNKNLKEILEYKSKLGKITKENLQFVLFPSDIYLSFFYDSNYFIGSQNLSIYNDGNHTGAILPNQLKSLKVKYCLLNHAEQKQELSDLIIKIRNANIAKIKVVLCIGENEKQDILKTTKILTTQLDLIFSKLTKEEQENIIIAYEPIWAINNEVIIDNNQTVTLITEIKKYIKLVYGLQLPVIYGGGINNTNIDNLLKYDILDGYILGKFSLNPENILNIIEKI